MLTSLAMTATGLEFKNVVFNAARDGKLRRLKVRTVDRLACGDVARGRWPLHKRSDTGCTSGSSQLAGTSGSSQLAGSGLAGWCPL